MYKKNCFKGQKLLIVVPYLYGMNEGEDKRLSYEYISKSYINNKCIQSSIDYTGIEIEVVINYKDAIEKLTRPGTYKNGHCDYYACIIMSGEPYPELPNPNDSPYLFGQFIRVIDQFWKNGGGLGLFADNAPYNYQINVLIEKLFPNSKFRIAGNHPGGKTLKRDINGEIKNKGTFNGKRMLNSGIYNRPNFSHNLFSLYEGKNISYFVEKPYNDNLLYFGKNEELKMIKDSDLILPFIPFSIDSDGGFNSAFYNSKDEKGDIVIDCSSHKFFLQQGEEGIPRYFQNIISWLSSIEKHLCIDASGNDYRPKSIDLQINWNDNWNGFKERPLNIRSPEDMKTLITIDCSKSISGDKIYFKKLREIKQRYYNNSRGDKFYIWGSGYYYKTDKEMDRFIDEEIGQFNERHSKYIAEIGRETKSENFEHLIIVTNGCVNTKDIDESDRRVEEYGLVYKYVTFYVTGDGNRSVGSPYMRSCPSVIFIIDKYGNEKQIESPSLKDIRTLKEIDSISNWNTLTQNILIY